MHVHIIYARLKHACAYICVYIYVSEIINADEYK